MRKRKEKKGSYLTVIWSAIDVRMQAFVVATGEMVALENGFLSQHGSSSTLHHLLWLFRYRCHLLLLLLLLLQTTTLITLNFIFLLILLLLFFLILIQTLFLLLLLFSFTFRIKNNFMRSSCFCSFAICSNK